MGELLKRGLVFCIESLDIVEVLIFGLGFIKVKAGILLDLPKHLRCFFFFAEIVFSYKKLTFLVKVTTLMCDWFHKTLPKHTFASWKKHIISTPVCLTLIFQNKKNCDWLKGDWMDWKGGSNKNGYVEYKKIFIWSF